MPRFPRSSIKTSYFHVVTQGINKLFIFNSQEDIKFYIKTMNNLVKDYPIKIIAYCIMNNHTHMLIKTEILSELSKFMHRLNSRYGRYYNKKYNRVGYVFRDRFKSEGIYTTNHLYNCIKYIYDNPVKAGICRTPEQYPYSNYKTIPYNVDESISFIDTTEDKEIEYKKFLHDFLVNNSTNLQILPKNKILLKELIHILKAKYNLSSRYIAKELHISRDTIKKLQ